MSQFVACVICLRRPTRSGSKRMCVAVFVRFKTPSISRKITLDRAVGADGAAELALRSTAAARKDEDIAAVFSRRKHGNFIELRVVPVTEDPTLAKTRPHCAETSSIYTYADQALAEECAIPETRVYTFHRAILSRRHVAME